MKTDVELRKTCVPPAYVTSGDVPPREKVLLPNLSVRMIFLLSSIFVMGFAAGWILKVPVCRGQLSNFRLPNYICEKARGQPARMSRGRRCNENPCPARRTTLEWKGCSRTCGAGEELQQECVYLVDPITNKPLTEGKCTTVQSRRCASRDCPVALEYGLWSNCSSSCGLGYRIRTVQCAQLLADGTQVSLDKTGHRNCLGITPRIESEKCRAPPCPLQWDAESWSACSATCENGHQTRTVVCKNVSSGVVINDSLCRGSKPAAIRDCTSVPYRNCPKWFAGDWQCNSKCREPGVFVRKITCKLGNVEIRATRCGQHNAPLVTKGVLCMGECPPKPTVSMKRIYTARIGEEVQIHCHVTGDPPPSVTFMWPNLTLQQTMMAAIRKQKIIQPAQWRGSRLVIKTMRAEYAGDFICRATNKHGGGTASGRLKVAVSAPSPCSKATELPPTISPAAPDGMRFVKRCNVTCGKGMTLPSSSCVAANGTKVEADECFKRGLTLSPQPPQPCDAGPCDVNRYGWTSWGKCSISCSEGGIKRRRCIDKHLDRVTDERNCSGKKGRSWNNTKPCRCFSWRYKLGPCSVTCGEGWARVIASCWRKGRKGRWSNQPKSSCMSHIGHPKNQTSRLCYGELCHSKETTRVRPDSSQFHWVTENWDACNHYYQLRVVYCALPNGTRVSEEKCAHSKKKVAKKPKTERPCFFWLPSNWSRCNSSTCTQYRTVTCIRANYQVVPGTWCLKLAAMPQVHRPCARDQCQRHRPGAPLPSDGPDINCITRQRRAIQDPVCSLQTLKVRLCHREFWQKKCKCRCRAVNSRRLATSGP